MSEQPKWHSQEVQVLVGPNRVANQWDFSRPAKDTEVQIFPAVLNALKKERDSRIREIDSKLPKAPDAPSRLRFRYASSEKAGEAVTQLIDDVYESGWARRASTNPNYRTRISLELPDETHPEHVIQREVSVISLPAVQEALQIYLRATKSS